MNLLFILSFFIFCDDCKYFEKKLGSYFPYSFSVYDLKARKKIKSCRDEMLLVPASSMKLIPSIYAFEKLGPDFRFKTDIGVYKNDDDSYDVIVKGGYDFTLGSLNFSSSVKDVAQKILKILSEKNINRIKKFIVINSYKYFPDGSIEWQDLGNYYATSVSAFSINDNLYRIYFRTYLEKTPAEILKIEPELKISFKNFVVAWPADSADEAYVYSSPYSDIAVIKGTIPANRDEFVVKASLFEPDKFFASYMCDYLKNNAKSVEICYSSDIDTFKYQVIETLYSPVLSEIVSVMNKKSFNLYADSLMHFSGVKEGKIGFYENLKDLILFLHSVEIDRFNIVDGSGLSRKNLFSADGFVKLLSHAYKSNYFREFYLSLSSPYDLDARSNIRIFNIKDADDIRVKTGSASRIRSFCGYIKKNNRIYAFSFIFNNYLVQPSDIVNAVVEYLSSI